MYDKIPKHTPRRISAYDGKRSLKRLKLSDDKIQTSTEDLRFEQGRVRRSSCLFRSSGNSTSRPSSSAIPPAYSQGLRIAPLRVRTLMKKKLVIITLIAFCLGMNTYALLQALKTYPESSISGVLADAIFFAPAFAFQIIVITTYMSRWKSTKPPSRNTRR